MATKVLIAPDFIHAGYTYKKPVGNVNDHPHVWVKAKNGYFPLDKAMVPMIKALWKKKIATLFCCQEGYVVVSMKDAKAALQIVKQFQPDACLCDETIGGVAIRWKLSRLKYHQWMRRSTQKAAK